MKYKLIFISCIIFIMLIGVFTQNYSVPLNRYHQHRSDGAEILSEETIGNTFSSHLPIMEINTDYPMPSSHIIEENDYRERNYESVSATTNYYDNETKLNSLRDLPTITENATIRIRGRSSRSYDKKSYLLKFKKDNLIDNKKVSLSGMTEDSEWALHGPYLDKTLIRNYICYNISGEIMGYSPNVRFCEVFINAEYQGIYLITEKIEYNDVGRINVTETDPVIKATSYILALDEGNRDEFYNLNTFTQYTGKMGPKNRGSKILEIVYPKTTLTVTQKEHIEDEISRFEKALVSFDSADRNLGYPAFIDVDSFVDYFIINEFTMNSDAGRLSTYFYKDIRGKMSIVVWDFNSAFNNYIPDMSEPHYFMMADKPWFEYLLKDYYFVDRVIKRYKELRKTYLSDEYLLNYIDETVAYLGPAIDRNYEVWGHSFFEEYDMLEPKDRNTHSYVDSVKQLKDIVVERGAYLDEHIEVLYALSHNSVNKQFKHEVGE